MENTEMKGIRAEDCPRSICKMRKLMFRLVRFSICFDLLGHTLYLKLIQTIHYLVVKLIYGPKCITEIALG